MHVQWVCLEHNRHVCYLHTFAKRSMFSSWDCQIRPRKARGYNKASNRGFEQNILWKKERCVRFDPLLLLGLHVTSKPRSALSLSSKVTLASPSSPLNLNFLIHRVRELNSGWHTHYLLLACHLSRMTLVSRHRPCSQEPGLSLHIFFSTSPSSHSHLTATDLRGTVLRLDGS